MKMRAIAALVVALIAVTLAAAHEIRPGYLQLRETGPGTYDVLWKVQGGGDARRQLEVSFPEGTVEISIPRSEQSAGSFVRRWTIRRAGGLSGTTIRVDGLVETATDVLVRLERADGTTQLARLTADAPSFTVEAVPGSTRVAAIYTKLGVEHILLGIDHLLYILAMLFLVRGWRRILLTMTAFTLTHSLTLTAAALGWVHVPQAPVEACIALSILFVAAEIVRSQQGKPSLTEQWPWVVSFTFGLLHGFGFAGALAEIGLPQSDIPIALLFFNVGVEIGQIAFVVAVVAVAAAFRKLWREVVVPQTGVAYAIGAVSAFWLIQRIAAF
jgi:hydrogenase/urease accessory protein HupE